MDQQDDTSGVIIALERAVRAGGEQARSRLVSRVRRTVEGVERALAPAVERGTRALFETLTKPENARKLQQSLASVAQFAMSSGFRADPRARLLFDFVDDLEQRHGRPRVLQVVVEHAVVYENDMLDMLIAAIQGGDGLDAPHDVSHMKEHAGDDLLALLCSLAALERDDEPPSTRQARLEYFDHAPIDARFKPLARMAVGEASAFEADEPAEDAVKAGPGRLRRALRKLTTQPTRSLTRHVPSLADPATRFVTTSYLFFVQSYLVRAMIEELPDVLEALGELERSTGDDSADVLDLGD